MGGCGTVSSDPVGCPSCVYFSSVQYPGYVAMCHELVSVIFRKGINDVMDHGSLGVMM